MERPKAVRLAVAVQLLLLTSLAFGFSSYAYWSRPVALTSDPGDDVQAAVSKYCNGIYVDWPVCLLWQRDGDIYSLFNSSGSGWSAEIPVDTDPGQDMSPTVAWNPVDSTWWAAWQSNRDGDWNVYATWCEYGVWLLPVSVTSDVNVDQNPSLAVDRNGRPWVTWESDRGGEWTIYASYHDGASWVSPVAVSTVTESHHPSMSSWFEGTGLVAVAWDGVGPEARNIFFSYYDAGHWSSEMMVSFDSVFANENPSLTGPAAGMEARVFWERTEGANVDLRYSYTWDGISWLPPETLTTHPGLDGSPDGFSIVVPMVLWFGPVWRSDRDGNSNVYVWDLHLWEPVAVDTHPADDQLPVISSVSAGDWAWVWAIWETDRDGDWNLYGSYQMLNRTGIEKGETSPGYKVGFDLCQSCPNPFAELTEITFQIPAPCQTALKIYDIGGRLVRTLVKGHRGPGRYTVRWDGRDSCGEPVTNGVYFCRLRACQKDGPPEVGPTGGQVESFAATRRMVVLR